MVAEHGVVAAVQLMVKLEEIGCDDTCRVPRPTLEEEALLRWKTTGNILVPMAQMRRLSGRERHEPCALACEHERVTLSRALQVVQQTRLRQRQRRRCRGAREQDLNVDLGDHEV